MVFEKFKTESVVQVDQAACANCAAVRLRSIQQAKLVKAPTSKALVSGLAMAACSSNDLAKPLR